MTARNFHDLKLPYKTSLINNGVDVENGINNLQVQFQYKFSDKWRSETNYLYSEGMYKHLMWTSFNFRRNGFYHRIPQYAEPDARNIQ